jgi:hypothetical protein
MPKLTPYRVVIAAACPSRFNYTPTPIFGVAVSEETARAYAPDVAQQR